MKKILPALLFLSIVIPNTVFAAIENWYAYWSIGIASNEYPSNSDAFVSEPFIDSIKSIPGVNRTESSIDMLGFYWPMNNNTMAGIVISGTGDRLQDSFDDYIQTNQYLYGLSGMKFFGREIGDGFFLRGDIGIARLKFDSNVFYDESSDNGFGYLIGTGFGIPISDQTRILLSVSFSNKKVEGDNYRSTSINIGGLW